MVPASDRGSQPELLQPAATNHALGKLSLRRLSPARPELQHSPSQPVQPEQLHQPRPLPPEVVETAVQQGCVQLALCGGGADKTSYAAQRRRH